MLTKFDKGLKKLSWNEKPDLHMVIKMHLNQDLTTSNQTIKMYIIVPKLKETLLSLCSENITCTYVINNGPVDIIQ